MNASQIKSITPIGKRNTIDIEVSDNNLFLANNILTHNSAIGSVTDVTEEHVQGGISKLQTADNVLAIIPNAELRAQGLIKIKILKSRDSDGTGKTATFTVSWPTLTLTPKMDDRGPMELPSKSDRMTSVKAKLDKDDSSIDLNTSDMGTSVGNNGVTAKSTADVMSALLSRSSKRDLLSGGKHKSSITPLEHKKI